MYRGMKDDDKEISTGNLFVAQIGESGIGLRDTMFYSTITMIAFGLSALAGVLVVPLN